MMRIWPTIAVALLVPPMAAQAENFSRCTKHERGVGTAALRNAKALALSAAVNVGDTPAFERWFGKYAPRNAERVRRNLKEIYVTIRSGAVTMECQTIGRDACEQGTYAYVYDNEPFHVYLCPPFFDMPTMATLAPDTDEGDNGTREGTLIHEISHFRVVARTADNCYSRLECADMAQEEVSAALANADSYQYFAEDVTYEQRDAELIGKPAVVNE